MGTRKSGRVLRGISMDDKFTNDIMEEWEMDDDMAYVDDGRKKAAMGGKRGSGSGGSSQPFCQVEDCTTDMTRSKTYHRRHKVCEVHAKAPIVVIAGHQQRFCQQCSRFHDLTEFDDAKGVVEGVWRDIMSEGEKRLRILRRKFRIIKK